MRLLLPVRKRSGVTLIEVLVAIFVASIGLLALLALFPVGALSMKQALKDSRCAQLAANAMALYRTRIVGQDPTVVTDSSIASAVSVADTFVNQIQTPRSSYAAPVTSYLGLRNAITTNGPSYPVYVDPLGVMKGSNHLPVCLDASSDYPRIPRHSISLISSAPSLPLYLSNFALLDDIYFESIGTNAGGPQLPAASTTFQRDPRYTYAYMLRRPLAFMPATMEVSVLVFAGRSLTTAISTAEENAFFPVTFDTTTTSVTIPYGKLGVARPTVKPGGWILDGTMLAADLATPDPHGFFYRVVDVIDGVDATNLPQVTLDLQAPPKQATTVGQLIVLDNVVEVFEKGSVSSQ